jgi:hypothetical protein
VSGAQAYKELCRAAKNEERRLAELRKRQQYTRTKGPTPQDHTSRKAADTKPSEHTVLEPTPSQGGRKCYTCGKPGHLARDCRSRKSESGGRPLGATRPTNAKQVQVQARRDSSAIQGRVDPLDFLESLSEDEVVRQVRVHDKGSMSQCV